MKTFTRISILVLVMMISSAVVFAQNNASKTTISDVELRMMQENHGLTSTVKEPTDFLATPITSFPYFQDFESGWPAEMDDLSGANATTSVETTYAYSGNSLFLEGTTGSISFSTPSTYTAAFDAAHATHFATVSMDVVPDGSVGDLTMKFMTAQGFSFNTNYSWFRVLVNGAVIFENGGNYYWQTAVHYTSTAQYTEFEFDLTAYDAAPFNITLQTSCKYQKDYYNEGDWTAIDNFNILYMLPDGDLEGYVMNGAGLAINGVTVGIEGWGIATSGPDGYYFMGAAPGGNQNVWAWKQGYNTVVTPAWVEPLGLGYQDIILTAPTMFISPTFHEYTLNPEEYFTTQTGITNTGDGPLEWSAEIVYPVTDVIAGEPQARTEFPNPNTDYSPTVTTIQMVNPPQRALWDVQLNFNTAYNGGEAGVETNGNFIYTTVWNGTGFEKYDMMGAHQGHIECGGVNGLRDLAFDGTYFYGAAAATSVSIMDLDNEVLIGTISAPVATRAIGYDDDLVGFYSNNWSDNITLWDMSGATISSFAAGGLTGIYGFAYDNWSAGGPYLWAFDQGGSGAQMVQFDLATQSSIFTLNVLPLVSGTQTAGGAFTTGSIVPGFISLGGNLQNEKVFALELAEGSVGGVGDWLTLDWYTNINPGFGFIENVPTNFDASGTLPGEVYTADIVFTSDPDVGTSTIPCTMIIAGDPLVPPTNLEVELVDDIIGSVLLSWDWTTDAFQFFIIKRNGMPIGTASSNSYLDTPLPDYGTYCYTVQAYYDEGYTAPAGPECVEWANPTIFINPISLYGEVWVGNTVDVYTTISNLGIGTLEYTFPDFYITMDLLNDPSTVLNQTGAPYNNEDLTFDKEILDQYSGTGYDVVLGAGGPDAFGYVWIDSDEAGGPTYNWMDISATGTLVTGLGDDNVVGPYNIGFNFPFYGVDKSQFWVNSNGTIGFTSAYITLTNYSIPTGNTYTDFIAWCWDDLDPGNASTSVWYETVGNVLVIQFDTYYEYPDGNRYVNAQMQLSSNGEINILYDYIDPGFDLAGNTIGIQSSDNTLGLQVAYNTAYMHDMLQVEFTLPADFIVDVQPNHGFVSEGDDQDIVITYDSDGYDPGDYFQELICESNDPANPSVIIDNQMHVYTPGQFAGTVTDCEAGTGISGVTVTAGVYQTTTDLNGDYSLYVDEDSYVVYFDKLGYESVIVPDTFAMAGVITPIDTVMCEAPYPVPFVTATVIYPDEDDCIVDWSLPEGPYEILYEDGTAEDLFVWSTAGNENAVRFTPAGYPATIIGGRVFVGDGSFPSGSWTGTEFAILVYDDDGTAGAPGTVLDSIPVVVTNYGWLEFYSMDPAIFDDGEFYLSMLQMTAAPNAAPIGIDDQSPIAYRSWSRMGGNEWNLSVYQDFMMRAFVDGPQTDMITDEGSMVYPPKVSFEQASKYFSTANNSAFVTQPGTVKSGKIQNIEGYAGATDGVDHYIVSRMSDFDPYVGPASGTETILSTELGVTYTDGTFGALPMGWYAYGVKVVYSSGLESPWVYSNIVGRDMDAEVIFEVTLCDGATPEDIEITMVGLDFPEETFFGVTDVTGIYTFDQVWKGEYVIEVYKTGYELYSFTATIMSDQTIEVMLSGNNYPPRNLWVDPLTSYAYWDPPLVLATFEDFEGATMPPAGWQMTTNDAVGWFLTTNGSSSSFAIPTWTSQYACSNDDEDPAGSDGDGSVDYLITPPLDLREVDTYHMNFDSYYDGSFGHIATVEYSYDAGATWDVLYAVPPQGGSWASVEIDLAAYSGLTAPSPIWLAFHSDDAGVWASGWAVDNALVANGETDPISYFVYLDGAFVAEVDTLFYQYQYLTYGVTYTSCVAARYEGLCGLSDEVCYSFTSGFLQPPRNLDGYTQDNAVQVWWEPPLVPETTLDRITEYPRTEFPNPNSDYSPMVQVVSVTSQGSSRATWDLQLAFPCGDASGEAGVETDGDFVYTTKWNAGNGTFFKYEMDGTFLGPVTVPGCQDVRDLAYNDDDGLFYGSNAGTTVWGINFTTLTVDNTISAPTAARAIAYDNDEDGLYANNWDTDVTLFDMSGAIITSYPVGALGSYYGLAYDKWTSGGPFLWAFSQGGSTAEIVQMDLAAGGAQIFNINVLPLVGGTQIGGGLYTHCGAYASNVVTIGGILQNETIFAFELAACSGGGGGGGGSLVVPDNLIGYKLYRDMSNIAYIPYNGEDTTYYWDLDLDPMCYGYDVTAIYDLTPFGFPGDTGESMYEGTFDICVTYGWPLPFVEEWTTGSFDPNLWTPGENWVVNGQIGNPEPCSEFKWDPILTDYRSGLTSYPIDGMYHPGTTDPYIDGKIWFEFEVSLNNVNATGDEYLNVEIWENGTWYNITSFSNADGSFDWDPQRFDISGKAFGNIFKVRFTAEGSESSDILSWFIDNVNIYRQCDAPTNLVAEGIDPVEIDLNWNAPASSGGTTGGEWIMWDDGVNAGDGIGVTGGGVFSVASHWDADMITQYDGQYITMIRFFPYDNAITTAFTLKVWQGPNAGTLLYEEALSGLVIGAWNDITLATPVMVDASQELWFGYTCDQPDGENPAGFDAGPGVGGYGDMITLDGATWDPIGTFGFDLNWNLQAYIAETTDGSSSPLTNLVDNTVYDNNNPTLAISGLNSGTTSVDDYETRALTGYNVYWNNDGAGYNYLDFTEDTFYYHIAASAFPIGSLQCYYVEAVWEDCEAASEEVCWIATGIENPVLEGEISVYPNPARDILNVVSGTDISRITMMNYVGQVVFDQKIVEDNSLEISVAGFEAGVYMVKVETSEGIVVKKITIL